MARQFSLPPTPRRLPTKPEDWRPVYEVLRRLQAVAQQSSASFAAIARGESPDGSGNALVDLSQYFYLPGRGTNQSAYGGVSDSGYMLLSSTKSGTKGFIYLGSAKTSMFDEANQRIGLNVVPLFRWHSKHTTTETMQRWEGADFSVTNCSSTGTTNITHASAGFVNVTNGMIVTGVGVPVGTVVSVAVNSGLIVLNQALPTGTYTLNFALRVDLSLEINGTGTDATFRIPTALQLITGNLLSGIRFTAQIGVTPELLNRAYFEAGYSPQPNPATGTNEYLSFTGFNGENGQSMMSLFLYQGHDTWDGTVYTHTARVGINIDPHLYRNSAAASQPDALLVARRTGATTSVATLAIENGASGATEYALRVFNGASGGTAPTATINNAPTFGVKGNGTIDWFTGGMSMAGQSGDNGWLQIFNNLGRNALQIRCVASMFRDAVKSTTILLSNTTDEAYRGFICGDLGNKLSRFGLCVTGMVIADTTTGGVPAPVAGKILTLVNSNPISPDTQGSVGFDVTMLNSARTITYTDNSGSNATDGNMMVTDAGDVLTFTGSVVLLAN